MASDSLQQLSSGGGGNLIPKATVATAKHSVNARACHGLISNQRQIRDFGKFNSTNWASVVDELKKNYIMKLPAIFLASTPVCIPQDTPPIRQSRCFMVNSMTFPIISDSARLCTSNQIIPRLNALHPPLVHKRTVSLETPAVHHHNHQRTLILQRRENYRYHQTWRKPFYGTSSEREEYRKELRGHLKRQMEEKCAALKLQLAGKGKEAEYAREVDRLALSSDREQRMRHSTAMTAYRDENKRLMEQRWRDRALTRSQEALKERELLCLNPINWSGTLK